MNLLLLTRIQIHEGKMKINNTVPYTGDLTRNYFTAYVEETLKNNRVSYYRRYNAHLNLELLYDSEDQIAVHSNIHTDVSDEADAKHPLHFDYIQTPRLAKELRNLPDKALAILSSRNLRKFLNNFLFVLDFIISIHIRSFLYDVLWSLFIPLGAILGGFQSKRTFRFHILISIVHRKFWRSTTADGFLADDAPATASAVTESTAAGCLNTTESNHQLTQHTAAGVTDVDTERGHEGVDFLADFQKSYCAEKPDEYVSGNFFFALNCHL